MSQQGQTLTNRRWWLVIVLCASIVIVTLGAHRLAAGQAILAPAPEEVRFQLLGNEPIAGPDGRGLVGGWSVLVFKDRKAGQCYVAFSRGEAIAATNAAACPP
jgi:hypothetical protein